MLSTREGATAREAVEEMIVERTPFCDIESYIDARADLSDDAKSALWLFAWVEADRDERRLEVDWLLRNLA